MCVGGISLMPRPCGRRKNGYELGWHVSVGACVCRQLSTFMKVSQPCSLGNTHVSSPIK